MDEFPGLLARDFGFRPQGKSAPMSSAKSDAVGGLNLGSGSARLSPSPATSWNRSRSGSNTGDSLLGGGISENQSSSGYDDVFGGPPRYSKSSSHARAFPTSSSPPSSDSILDGFRDSAVKSSSLPVYDKPVYDDDDIFDGVPGIKNSSSVKYEDVFSSVASNHASSPPYDDLLENLGRTVPEPKGSVDKRSEVQKEQELSGFDELIPGFGGSSRQQRETTENKQQSAAPSAKPTSNVPEDPFVVLETTSTSAYPSSGLFDPLEHITKPMNSGTTKVDASPASRGIFDDSAFDELTKSVYERSENPKDKSPLKTEKEPPQRSSLETFENIIPKVPPTKPPVSLKPFSRSAVKNSDTNVNTYERNATEDQSPKSYGHLETADDAWLTVAEIPLCTQPTSVPPPSRPPPPVAIKEAQFGKTDRFSSVGLNAKRMENESFSQFTQSYQHLKNSVKKVGASPIDELEVFAMGKPQRYAEEHAEVLISEEETEMNSAAAASSAAMKEAMDRAEAKFKHAREVRERERDAKSAKSRESAQQERDEKAIPDAQDPEDWDKLERLKREEKEEQKRREKEREQELERERQRARQAVERATREARERAATGARLKAERAAVDKVNAETRQRAERDSVQRATAEVRERAAAEAREKAEKATAEARDKAAAESRAAATARERAAVERAAAETRLRSDRAAVDRATAEARERAAAGARERAAREKQHKPENDLESFFRMGARPNSAPKQRATTSESVFDAQFQSKGGFDAARRTSPGSSFTHRKEPSSTTIVDDLTSFFGAPPSSGDFQEVEGETEDRRRARLDRHQRTAKRVEEALAKKNERDMQVQRDQAERHRIAETLDIEIKRWAAGKEGNLRALLSTLQYVLWPECGWQPVSLTDLIIGASVKKVYRKATLCIHPDKVQQKGANLQQKYIAEKVFDILKEAWNKFNSEELF